MRSVVPHLAVAERIEKQMAQLGMDPRIGVKVKAPRWRVDSKVVEFDCGCRAIRCFELAAIPEKFDPIIFHGLPEQAVYDHVCKFHEPSMNDRCHFGGFVDFGQWKRARLSTLLGKTTGRTQ